MPWGGAYGTPGPDTGYALKLVKERMIPLADGEDRHNAEDAIAALVGARASHFRRAPTPGDVDVAMLVLGYRDEGVPKKLLEELAAARLPRIANIGHDVARERALVSSVSVATLASPLFDLTARMAGGEALVDWRLP